MKGLLLKLHCVLLFSSVNRMLVSSRLSQEESAAPFESWFEEIVYHLASDRKYWGNI